MGLIELTQPQFLAGHLSDMKFRKLMFLKKGGKAVSKAGNLSRDVYNVELICVSNEDEDNWIGNFAEGFGFYNVKFAKEDCRCATEEEIESWTTDRDSVKF